MDKNNYSHHISRQFNEELEDIRNKVMVMGGLVEEQIENATAGLVSGNVEQAEGLFAIPSFYKTLLILPWDHSFAHTVGIFPLMKNGASLASIQVVKTPNETLKNIPINARN